MKNIEEEQKKDGSELLDNSDNKSKKDRLFDDIIKEAEGKYKKNIDA